jgi:lipopolysaccharide export system permease protein
VYVTNRMSQDSELVVVQATGYSGFRLARPVLVFGVVVAFLMSLLSHVLMPMSTARLLDRTAEVSQNITAKLLSAGQFQHPANGVTLFISDITERGELVGLFLSDARNPERSVTYTAKSALLVRGERGAKLVMLDGQAQTHRASTNQIAITTFTDFAYNIGGLISSAPTSKRKVDELSTSELLAATLALQDETGASHATLITEAHLRFVRPLMAPVSALIGFAFLMVGSFSRFGIWPRVVWATITLVLTKLVENITTSKALADASLWPLMYLSVLGGTLIAITLLWLSARPSLLRRRTRESTT